MVILIGGSSHVGKTLIAHWLVARNGYECIGLDLLAQAFRNAGPVEFAGLDDYSLRYQMWPFVAEIIRKAVAGDRNLIIEGCYIPSEWARSFTKGELGSIRCVFIVMSPHYIQSHMDEIREHAQAAELRSHDTLDMGRLIDCSAEFKAQCIKTGTYYIEIDGPFDEDSLLDAVEAVIEDPDPAERGMVL